MDTVVDEHSKAMRQYRIAIDLLVLVSTWNIKALVLRSSPACGLCDDAGSIVRTALQPLVSTMIMIANLGVRIGQCEKVSRPWRMRPRMPTIV